MILRKCNWNGGQKRRARVRLQKRMFKLGEIGGEKLCTARKGSRRYWGEAVYGIKNNMKMRYDAMEGQRLN